MKYLHETSPGIFHLDHRLTPEVRAMLAAMVSRAPVGGIRQRYTEIVDAVAAALWDEYHRHGWKDLPNQVVELWRDRAEDALTSYPLPAKVQGFFDEFVGHYGHASVLELTGSPTIVTEGVSWFTAWLLFDSPLATVQEFSTRAVQRADWPMARECATTIEERRSVTPVYAADGSIRKLIPGPIEREVQGHPDLDDLHRGWLEVYDAEVAWWREYLSVPDNRASLGIGDKEPFRPALDRARWALPGTYATGAAFASHVRERARALRDARHVNGPAAPTDVWGDIEAAYHAASPGLAQYGLREAVAGQGHDLPGHLAAILEPVAGARHPSGVDVSLRTLDWPTDSESPVAPYARTRDRSYVDPWFNRQVRVRIDIECSLAVARDWHRHRPMYPWHLGVVLHESEISIDRRYAPRSEVGILRTPELLRQSGALYRSFLSAGDRERAALALPLGTRVKVSGAGGLRDVVYMLELRAHAHGANFEYRGQAEAALYLLDVLTRLSYVPGPHGEDDVPIKDAAGLHQTPSRGTP